MAHYSHKDDIIQTALPLYARKGFDAVSMRDIAQTVGISAAAIYYHFPNKQALYLAVMKAAFSDVMKNSRAIVDSHQAPEAKLQCLITSTVHDLAANPNTILLIQRERLDGDETRTKLLVDEVYIHTQGNLILILQEFNIQYNARFLAGTISGMILHHLFTMPIAHLLPGWKTEHNDPDYISKQIFFFAQSIIKSCPRSIAEYETKH